MAQRARVNAALEDDHVLDRIPEIDPTPLVELGAVGMVQGDVGFVPGQPELVALTAAAWSAGESDAAVTGVRFRVIPNR